MMFDHNYKLSVSLRGPGVVLPPSKPVMLFVSVGGKRNPLEQRIGKKKESVSFNTKEKI